MLALQARIRIYYLDRGELLLHLIAQRFEKSENAGADIENWLRSNHVPFERMPS